MLSVLAVLGLVGALVVFATIHDSGSSTTAETVTPSFTYPSFPSSESALPTTTSDAGSTSTASSAETSAEETTTPAGPQPVQATANNPLFGNQNSGLPNIRCSLPQWVTDEAAATAFFTAARACLDKMWQPVLAAQHLPFSSPNISAPAHESEVTDNPCSGGSPNWAAVYCSANNTIYMPLDHIQTDTYGDRWYIYMMIFAHEYGHHVQAISGVMGEEDSEREDAGAESDKGLELSRRLELEAQCFGGMFVGSSTVAGLYTNDETDYVRKDQYERGDELQQVDMHDHGTSQHYGDWYYTGQVNDRVQKCNTWNAAQSDVS